VNKSLPVYRDHCSGDSSSVRHLLKGKDLRMSGVLWELGLREYATDRKQEKRKHRYDE
jgi:hypothetical protein